jgi:hypothetical protein
MVIIGRWDESGIGAGLLARRDEPDNPFTKKPGHSGPRYGRPPREDSRAKRTPGSAPQPPGTRKPVQAPPPPGGDKSESKKPEENNVARGSPAAAGGRKSVGLRPQVKEAKSEPIPTEERAKLLIEQKEETELAQDEVVAVSVETTAAAPTRVMPSTAAKKLTPEQRRANAWKKKNRPRAPAKRVKKLHRGKYMEFKYDVRKILDEETVSEEFRSNILGQTWAKGERMGVEDAKTFLNDKVAAGELPKRAAARIISLINSLTTRR